MSKAQVIQEVSAANVRAHVERIVSEIPHRAAGSENGRRMAEYSRDAMRQSGAEVSGSILRVDGDTGTLVGHWKDGKLVLSHFAGERPNLFEATLNPDGTLAVTLNRTARYLVVRSGDARAKGIPEPPDPSRYTSVADPTTPFAFAFPDLTGNIVSNADARFRGKVVILSIGGSWCPNCHDEAPFLSELYKDYRARGLEIVGLMFENDPDPAVSRPRVQSFIKRYGIHYPMLFAGTTRYYFIAYRDSCPTFCNPSVRNKSNSYAVTWVP